MNDSSHDHAADAAKDFSRFQRIPEGCCELLSARYSNQHSVAIPMTATRWG